MKPSARLATARLIGIQRIRSTTSTLTVRPPASGPRAASWAARGGGDDVGRSGARTLGRDRLQQLDQLLDSDQVEHAYLGEEGEGGVVRQRALRVVAGSADTKAEEAARGLSHGDGFGPGVVLDGLALGGG